MAINQNKQPNYSIKRFKIMIWHNPNKTSPLDSFFNPYMESIRIKGNRNATIYDFIVVCNTRLFMEYRKVTPSELAKMIDEDTKSVKEFLELKSRFSADKVYKIAQALGIALSEFFDEKRATELTGEKVSWRFS
jgi:hypothetical protein